MKSASWRRNASARAVFAVDSTTSARDRNSSIARANFSPVGILESAFWSFSSASASPGFSFARPSSCLSRVCASRCNTLRVAGSSNRSVCSCWDTYPDECGNATHWRLLMAAANDSPHVRRSPVSRRTSRGPNVQPTAAMGQVQDCNRGSLSASSFLLDAHLGFDEPL